MIQIKKHLEIIIIETPDPTILQFIYLIYLLQYYCVYNITV